MLQTLSSTRVFFASFESQLSTLTYILTCLRQCCTSPNITQARWAVLGLHILAGQHSLSDGLLHCRSLLHDHEPQFVYLRLQQHLITGSSYNTCKQICFCGPLHGLNNCIAALLVWGDCLLSSIDGAAGRKGLMDSAVLWALQGIPYPRPRLDLVYRTTQFSQRSQLHFWKFKVYLLKGANFSDTELIAIIDPFKLCISSSYWNQKVLWHSPNTAHPNAQLISLPSP